MQHVTVEGTILVKKADDVASNKEVTINYLLRQYPCLFVSTLWSHQGVTLAFLSQVILLVFYFCCQHCLILCSYVWFAQVGAIIFPGLHSYLCWLIFVLFVYLDVHFLYVVFTKLEHLSMTIVALYLIGCCL